MSEKVSRRGLLGLFGGGAAALASPQSVAAAPPVSAFKGISDIRANVSSRDRATITGAASVYVSDFGTVIFAKAKAS